MNIRPYPPIFILLHTLLSVQLGHSVVSESLQPHGLQHNRFLCPSPTPGTCSHSCPLSQWCHPIISSSVVPFSSCLQSCPASESFLMSQLFSSGGQSIGASASASVFPVDIQSWFPLGLTGLISLQSKRLSGVFSNTTVQKHQLILQHSAFFMVQLSEPYMTTGKTIALTRQTFVSKVTSLLFNMLSRLVIAFLTICSDFGAQENKVCHCFHCFLIYLTWRDGTRCHDLSFLNVEFQANFFIFLFHLIKTLLCLLLK